MVEYPAVPALLDLFLW